MKTTTCLKNLTMTLLLGVITTHAHAKPTAKLPFIGEKNFNFAERFGTEYSIKISKNGMTTVTLNALQSSEVLYKGKYQNPIPIDGGEYYYRINGKFIEQLDKNKQISHECSDIQGNDTACREKLN